MKPCKKQSFVAARDTAHLRSVVCANRESLSRRLCHFQHHYLAPEKQVLTTTTKNNTWREMPDKQTKREARRLAAKGYSPTTQAGPFVREQMHHLYDDDQGGNHAAKTREQAIAIGLSQARRAGVPLPAFGKQKPKRTSKRKATTTKKKKSQKPSNKRQKKKSVI